MQRKSYVKYADKAHEVKAAMTAREYIEREYPNLNRLDSIPDLLRAILAEVVNGRLKHE